MVQGIDEIWNLAQNLVCNNKKQADQNLVCMKCRKKCVTRQASLRLSKEVPELEISFTAGALSPFGGLPILEKISRMTGLLEGAAACLKDHRTQSLIGHNKLDLLKQCVLLTATGNADTNDADRFRFDPALLAALDLELDGSEGGLASQPSVSRFLNDATASELDAIADWLVEFYIRHHQRKPKRLYLYVDGTAVETFGAQEGATYRSGKYKKEMYFPITVYDQSGWLIAAKLRQGNKSEAKTIVGLLEWLIPKLRDHWRHMEIVVVVDSGFRSSTFLNWCEKNSVFYLAGYGSTFAIDMKPEVKEAKRKAENYFKKRHGEPQFLRSDGALDTEKAQAEHLRIREIKDPKERLEAEKALKQRLVRVFVDTKHRANTWPKEDPERRLVARFDYTDKGLDSQRILTNFECYTDEQLYQMYCSRGASEKWIGETKNSFNLRFNSQSFHANQFRLYIHVLAYTLLWLLRSSLSWSFRNRSIDTIRKTFVEIPAAATRRTRWKTSWELVERYRYPSEFLRVVRKLERAS